MEKELLQTTRLPARVDMLGASVLTGFSVAELSILVAAGILRPLGRIAPNSIRWFASRDLVEFAQDRERLDKACRIIQQHWKAKNAAQKAKLDLL